MKKLLFIFIVIVGIAACKTTTQIYAPSEANVNKVEKASLEELNKGRDIYASKCGKCHKLYAVESRDARQWKEVLGVMAPKAKLSDAETDLVYRYLLNR